MYEYDQHFVYTFVLVFSVSPGIGIERGNLLWDIDTGSIMYTANVLFIMSPNTIIEVKWPSYKTKLTNKIVK